MDLVEDKKGVDVLLLDTRAISSFSDYFVIATAESERQSKAIIDDIQKSLRKQSVLKLSAEGTPESGWILLDYGSVIVHLFSPAMRDYYQLEELWDKAPVVVRIQ